MDDGVETPGVIWESPTWRLLDNGVIFFKNASGDGKAEVVQGVQYFGYVDSNNTFQLFPKNKNYPTTLDQVK